MNKQKVLAAAQKYASKGNLARAVREYERIVAEDPGDLRIRLKVGDLHAKLGNIDSAVAAFEYVARAHAAQGFMLKAVAVYKRIIQITPENVTILTRLAEAYLQQGRMSDAVAYYNAVAQLMLNGGDSEGYVRILNRMLEMDPSNVGVRIKLAEHFSKLGDNPQAIIQFAAAADHLKESGRVEDYIKVAERLIFHQPEALDRVKELVRVYLDRGDARRALAKLQLCFKADPHDTETLGLLVKVFFALNQNEKAIQVLREKARAHDRLKQEDDARATWEQVLEHVPEDQEATEALKVEMLDSELLAPISTGEFEAIQDAQQNPFAQPPQQPPSTGGLPPQPPPQAAAAGVPAPAEPLYKEENPEVQRLLVETDVYIKYGLFDQANDHLSKVFALDSTNLDAMERLKEIYFQTGYYPQAVDELLRMAQLCVQADWERAVSYLKEALQIMPHSDPAQAMLQQWGLTWEQLFPRVEQLPTEAFPDLASVDAILAELAGDNVMMEQAGAEPISNDASLTGQFKMPEDLEEHFQEHMRKQGRANELDELEIQDLDAVDDELVSIDVDFGAEALDPSGSSANLDAANLSMDVAELSTDDIMESFDASLDFNDSTAANVSFEQIAGQEFAHRSPTSSYGQGQADLSQAPDSLPDDLGLDLAECDFYFKQGLYEEARATLVEIMSRWPDHPAVLERYAAIEQALGGQTPHTPLPEAHHSASSHTPQASDGALNESGLPLALYEDPEMSGHFELGLAFRELGLYQDAVNEFQEAAQAGQEIAQSLFWMGQCYLENNDIHQAIELFEQSVQYVHSATELLLHIDYRLGLSYELLGQHDLAAGYFQKVIEYPHIFPDAQARVARLVVA